MFSLCFVLLVFFGFSLCFFMHRVAVHLYNILTYQKKKKNLIYLALSYDLRPLQSLHPYELLIHDTHIYSHNFISTFLLLGLQLIFDVMEPHQGNLTKAGSLGL